jgi:hypothetical protein
VIGVVVTRVLEYHAFEPIQHRVMVAAGATRLKASNFKRVSRLYRFEGKFNTRISPARS